MVINRSGGKDMKKHSHSDDILTMETVMNTLMILGSVNEMYGM